VQVDPSLIVDTVRGWIEEQRPVYETVINRYFVGRRLTTFFGLRTVIPAPSLPSIEVAFTGDTTRRFAPRVPVEEPALEIHVTVDIRNPVESALRCLHELATLTNLLLLTPPRYQPPIENTGSYLALAWAESTTYETLAGDQRVAKISWRGQHLIHLSNSLFEPALQVPPPLIFPPL
jgi:hypothetical protein